MVEFKVTTTENAAPGPHPEPSKLIEAPMDQWETVISWSPAVVKLLGKYRGRHRRHIR